MPKLKKSGSGWFDSSFAKLDFHSASAAASSSSQKQQQQQQMKKQLEKAEDSGSDDSDIVILSVVKGPPKKTDNQSNRKRKLSGIAPKTESFSPATLPSSSAIWQRDKEVFDFKAPTVKKSTVPLLDRFPPVSQADLAMHPKKVAEVAGWLTTNSKSPRILLLTGPPGSGKTATLRAICNDRRITLVEWTNTSEVDVFFQRPTDDSEWRGGRRDDDQYEVKSVSETKQFAEFLRRTDYCGWSQSNSVSSDADRIVLVEELPNKFYEDPQELHEILRSRLVGTRRPIVFIVSDVASSFKLGPRQLFPPAVVSELNIHEIAFNAVASSYIQKGLKRAVDKLGASYSNAANLKTRLKEIAEAADGDIRSAIFKLEFALNEKNALGGASKKSVSSSAEASGVDRHALDVFRALGKLLYAKRGPKPKEAFTAAENLLPPHLSHLARPTPLESDPDDVIDRCHLSADKLTSFLHENELDFAPDLESAQRALDDLSLFDASSRLWDVREDAVERFGGLIAAKSVAFWNFRDGGPKNLGFHQMRKAKATQVRREADLRRLECLRAFDDYRNCWPVDSLTTVLTPYLALMNARVKDYDQQRVLEWHKFPLRQGRRYGAGANTSLVDLSGVNQDQRLSEEPDDVMNIESFSDSDSSD
uniref:Cell cycle checkpoint protein RAD17 n=1 Tax=Plectus sambesii TaxID=2011161 RepID=A0A914UXF0_9BILA